MIVADYLRRIGFCSEPSATLATLSELQKRHLLSVPFENLDIHNGRKITLSIQRFYEKVVIQQRGGFCYELNGLFRWLLTALGFSAHYVSARVATGDGGYGAEFDHMAIWVNIEEIDYLVDVGFGEFAFAPLMLKEGIIQRDARGDFALSQVNGSWQVNKIVDTQTLPEYRLTTTPRTLRDFAEMCDYHQTSPKSHFTQKRLISRPTENGRITLSGNTLTIRENNETIEKKLPDEIAFVDALAAYFPSQ